MAAMGLWRPPCTQGIHGPLPSSSCNACMTTVHEQYAFLPSDLPNYAFRAGRLAFHGGKTRLWPVGLHIKSVILCMHMYFLLDF